MKRRSAHFAAWCGLSLGALSGSVVLAAPSSEMKTMPEGLPRVPIVAPFDYGFEAEFKGSGGELVQPDRQMVAAAFDFLEPHLDFEFSGNKEVRSYGGETNREEVRQQMLAVKNAVNHHRDLPTDGLKSFHLHIFIDIARASPQHLRKFEGFASRLGDYILAWRLTHRRSYLALQSYSLQRSLPATMAAQGAVRVRENSEFQKLDVEIRGGMDDINFIMHCADLVESFWSNVEVMPDVSQLQTALLANFQGNRIDLARSLTQELGRTMTASEQEFFDFLMTFVRAHSLPLMGAALDPMFSEHEKAVILRADQELVKNATQYVLTHHGRYPFNVQFGPETVENFLNLFRDWARESEIFKTHARVLQDLSHYQTADLNQKALSIPTRRIYSLQDYGRTHTGMFRSLPNVLEMFSRCAGAFLPIVLR